MVKKKILSLEAMRGIAALLVVLFHATQGLQEFFKREAFNNFFLIGSKGVDLFFVLSGFIIFFVHYQDIHRPERFQHYLWKRFSRIYPSYWIACSLALVFYFLQGRLNGKEFDFQNIFNSFLLLPNQMRNLLVVSWTLTFEVMFYFLFALLILNQTLGRIVFSAWALGIVYISIWEIPLSLPYAYFLNSRNVEFFWGMLAALYLIHYPLKFPSLIACIGFCIFLGFALGEVYFPFPKTRNIDFLMSHLIYGCGGSLFILGIVGQELKNKVLVPFFLSFLGSTYYSIYLIHVPALLLFYKMQHIFLINFLFSSEIFLIVGGAFGVFMGIIFYWLIEKPLRLFLANLMRKYAT